jgi:hypothetical protein
LLVGRQRRGSLRELAIQRLGPVDYALVAPRFFDESLADRLAAQPYAASRFDVVPAVLVRGGASNASGGNSTGAGAGDRGERKLGCRLVPATS